MVTAKEVGGDFYDYYFIDEDRLAFAVGDVSGKGIPAAIYMAVSRTLLKAIASQVVNPGEVLRKLNTLLIPESESATFVTVFFGVLNIRTGEMQFCNGAHNSPYLLKTTGAVEQLPLTDGSILGKIPHMDFETKRVKLDKGDTLYLYTDGVTEAMDPESAQYEDARLKSYLGSARTLSIRELIQGISRTTSLFSHSAISALHERSLPFCPPLMVVADIDGPGGCRRFAFHQITNIPHKGVAHDQTLVSRRSNDVVSRCRCEGTRHDDETSPRREGSCYCHTRSEGLRHVAEGL
jgi:hypothetical protein